MSDNGWIKIHRKIRDNWIWEDANALKAWVDIIMMVNHQDKKIKVNGKIVTIKRGEKLTSITKLAERWGWSRKRVMRFLDLLESDGMCTTIRTTNGTTLKVSNYAEYQDFQTPKGTTNGTANDTAHDTADDTPPDTQTIMNKNNKNDKEVFLGADAQKKVPPAFEEVKAYCQSKGIKIEVTEFMQYYDMRGWTLTNGRKITDWHAAVDYWYSKSRKDAKADAPPMPYFEEVSGGAPVVGVAPPFEGGVVAELIRRKRAKNA